MTVLAIDPSLTSSGFSYLSSRGDIRTGTITPKKLSASERLHFIEKRVIELVEIVRPSLVAYEGYAMGIRGGGRVFDIGELGGVLKLYFWRQGIDALIISPTTLKLYTCGIGNAKKPQMAAAIKDRYGYDIKQDDEVDAFALLKAGEHFLRDSESWPEFKKCKLIPGAGRNLQSIAK